MSPRSRAIFLLFASSFLAAFLATTVSAQSPAPPPSAPTDPCANLARLQLPTATITQAQLVPAGTFSGPPAAFSGTDLTPFYKSLPAFCRVVAEAKPTADSDIKLEVWLPASGWNGKLQGIGNGGFAGIIDYYQIGAAMKKGYASTATDAGHTGSPIDASWALGHPEKVVDFGHRGIHEMTRVAKAVIQSYYGSNPKHSYFAGCSDGGREALMEAQRYPTDYDGILAGAPANYWSALLSTAVIDTQALTVDPASFIPQSKLPTISAAVLAACDELDGVRDGILNDPRQCHFDPATIQCKAGEESDKCLTAPQIAALKTIYDGLHDSTGHQIFPGFMRGAEDGPGGWGLWITGPAPARSLMTYFGFGFYTYMVYEKTDWNYKTFTLAPGMKAAEDKTAAALNATDPNLKPFRSAGGKLILYHGWEDPAIPSVNSVNYYDSVVTTLGKPVAASFVRLYMLPGVQHCGGGPGPDTFGQVGDWFSPDDPQHNARFALEQWVEKGTAPDTIIATKPNDDPQKPQAQPKMTRPLCAYPESAKYKATGDTNDAANFVCAK
jgi:Tannase and feruloyl esterase